MLKGQIEVVTYYYLYLFEQEKKNTTHKSNECPMTLPLYWYEEEEEEKEEVARLKMYIEMLGFLSLSYYKSTKKNFKNY